MNMTAGGRSVTGPSVVVASACIWLLLLPATAAPAGREEAVTAAWRTTLEDTVELEPLPSPELDMLIQRRVSGTKHISPGALDPDQPRCLSTCLPGSRYTIPPPGSHCGPIFRNPGC
ncbi:hypothetical protein ABZP36_008317 [Zizania latifolia]